MEAIAFLDRRCVQCDSGRMMRNDRFNFTAPLALLSWGSADVAGADGDFKWRRTGCTFGLGARSSDGAAQPRQNITCTLFGPYDGEDGLNHLTTDEAVQSFFNGIFRMSSSPNLLDD